MPLARPKPISQVAKSLSSTEFNSRLSCPWLCELHSDSLKEFCDIANQIITRLEVAPTVYSFFPDSKLTQSFVESLQQQGTSHSLTSNKEKATVICIDNVWQWDPVGAVAPYLHTASIVDQILTKLPYTEQGHTLVEWRRISKIKNFPSLRTVLSAFTSDASSLREDLFLCQKQIEELKLLQMALLDAAFSLNASDADKLVNDNEPLLAIARAVFGPLCKTKQYDYLPILEMGLASTEAAELSKMEDAMAESWLPLSRMGKRATVDGLLRKHENAILLAHCEDTMLSSLTDDALQNCRPIIFNAVRDAFQLTSLTDAFLLLTRLIGLLPARGCNPNAKSNSKLIELIDSLFHAGFSMGITEPSSVGECFAISFELFPPSTHCRFLVLATFLRDSAPKSIGNRLLAASYQRHLLPSYRESVINVGHPQLVSPVVQMIKDLALAHENAASVSPGLQSLRLWPTATGQSNLTILSNVSKLISMSKAVTQGSPTPYATSLVILVIHGTITWALARDIVMAATRRNARASLEIFIICKSLLRGRDICSQCLPS